jgi:subtilisin-like proprotein convertase family protein
MNKKILIIFCLTLFITARSQVFTGTGGAITDNGQELYFPISVSGLSAPIDSVTGIEQVCINITHPNVSELYISLMSPSGTLVELTLGSSNSGADYLNTCFDNAAGNSITLASAPYTGTFKPVGFLGRFNTGQTGNGTWNLIVKDGFPVNGNVGNVVSWSLQFGSATPAHPVLFSSSNLPIVFINAAQPISDFSTTVTMGVVDNGSNRNNLSDAWNNYNGNVRINTRGHTSKNYPKKSYSIETNDVSGNQVDVPLLGMPAESDWALIANYSDKTLLRNCLSYDLFRSMGRYSPRYKNVELVINNEYRGVYTCVEKPKRNSNRINIEKLDPTENTIPYVTGGYVLKIDRNDSPGWYSYLPGNNTVGAKFYYQYSYPKSDEITSQQSSYIQTYMNDFENMMNSPGYADPNTGYPKYLDVNSFVDYFIISELSKNVDAYRLSAYIFKESDIKGGKISAGPVWDFDLAYHNANYGWADNTAGWAYTLDDASFPVPTWWMKLMQDTGFQNKLTCRWFTLRQNVLSLTNMNAWVDNNANILTESQQRNFKFWPVLGAYIFPNPQSQAGANYNSELGDLKNWLAGRVAWMDANMPGQCAVGMNEENSIVRSMKVFPNPIQQKAIFSLTLERSADISLSITDVAGKEVARYLNNKAPQGESEIVFDRGQIKEGIYFYQLQVDENMRTGKIIIQ